MLLRGRHQSGQKWMQCTEPLVRLTLEGTACSLDRNQDLPVHIKSAMSPACGFGQLAVHSLWGHAEWHRSMSGSGGLA